MHEWKTWLVGRSLDDLTDGWMEQMVERRGLDNWMDGRNVG